ncbi:MAG: hypothetical protein EP341_06365 [Sphingomonadales bacterium]|nr:MAG: hypothetical protein EP341_06365 [Sphingomonadales bacterium]
MTEDKEQQAKQRFAVLNLVRLAGLLMVLAGIAVTQKALNLPDIAGWMLALGGAGVFFFVPALLAKGWRSQDQ